MKKILFLSIVFSVFQFSINAQTAINWTKSDCSGNNHTLFTYLNNEEVVIMEFAMGCSSCTNAAAYLMSTKNKYAISNPGKVNVFYMDYWAGNTCATGVITSASPYAFDAVFDHCNYEKDDYFTSALSPMPGIVIAAGSLHQVIYQMNSFSLADTLLMEQAITTFFATAGINETSFENSISISPNPSNGVIQLNFNNTESQKIKISIFTTNGQLIKDLYNEDLSVGNYEKKIDISHYAKGMYYLSIENKKRTAHKKIIIN